MQEIVNKIVQWHIDRNLIEGATDEGQFKKLMSEFGEYSDNLAKDRCVKDDIGDIGVVLINIAARNNLVPYIIASKTNFVGVSYHELHYCLHEIGYYMHCENGVHYVDTLKQTISNAWNALCRTANNHGCTMQSCLEHAYDDIKDRKGKMINGTFIKEDDL